MSKLRLARIISVILGPPVWWPLLFTVFIFNSGLTIYQKFVLLPSLLLLEVIIPLSYLFIAPKIGLATAWDLPNRKDRYPFFAVISFTSLSSILLVYLFGTKMLLELALILLFLLLVVAVITLFWKISIHASLATAGAILVNFLFDFKLPYLYLSIPVVFWARLVLKRHTITQLLAGVLVSGGLTLISLKLLNLE